MLMRPIVFVLKALILPPLSLFVLGIVGWLLARRWPRVGRGVILATVIAAYLLATPYVSTHLLRSLQTSPPLTPEHTDDTAGAIVVLSSNIYYDAPEYGGDTVGSSTLMRLRYGAKLFQQTGLPLLVSGGVLSSADKPLAIMMQEALMDSFHVPTRWTETASRTTYENAKFSAQILRRAHVRTIYLVTHAWHMPRAKAAFEAFGLLVIPAPTAFTPKLAPHPKYFLPTTHAFHASYAALHEWVGRLWYALRFRLEPTASTT